MYKFNQYNQKLNEAGEGGDPGSGDGGEGGSQPTVEELQAKLADATGQVEAMRGKMDQLLGETKKAKQARRDAEIAAQKEADELAKKQGDFEQLFNSSQSEAERLRQERDEARNFIATEKVNNAAMKLATELADGANAELLSEFIARRLKYSDETIKVLDNNGDLTVSTLDNLKDEFLNDAKYSALLKGSQGSGSGASGNGSTGSTDKVISRSEFDKLDPQRQSKFMKDGGQVTD